MARGKKAEKKSGTKNGANLGFEQKLWQAADKLRGNMDAADYKHVVLGLIFLKYISDASQEHYETLKKEPHADPEDRDEYTGEHIFWVPKAARWPNLEAKAKQPSIGKLIDEAMLAIEKDNPSLRGVLPKDYARESLDKHRLGELIDLIGTIGLGDKESRSKDILGRVYEYFLGQFAAAEGKKGGQFYTARCVVKLLVEMTEAKGCNEKYVACRNARHTTALSGALRPAACQSCLAPSLRVNPPSIPSRRIMPEAQITTSQPRQDVGEESSPRRTAERRLLPAADSYSTL